MTKQLRHIIYSIVAVLLMQSCHEDSHTMLTDVEAYAISMSVASVADMTSRAIISDDAALQSTAIGVYAYKQLVDETQTMVFDNIELTYDHANGWDYSPKKYWDRAAVIYRFVAFSPYTATHGYANHTLTISDIPYWQKIDGSEIDYLVASSSGSANDYLNNQISTAVNFSFRHVLSQLLINITKDESLVGTEYKLKKVDFLNVPEGEAKASYSLSQEGVATLSTVTVLEEDATLNQFTNDEGIYLTTSNIPLSHLVVPFTLTNGKKVQVEVTYTVEGTQRTKTVDTGIEQLAAGKRYELTLTFKGAEILPTLEVKDWANVDVEDEEPKFNW